MSGERGENVGRGRRETGGEKKWERKEV